MNRQNDFALNKQIGIERERVLGDVDRSLDGVLEREEGVIDLAVFGGAQNVGKGVERAQVGRGEVVLAQQCLLGEGPDGAEEGDRAAGPVGAGCWCCG